MYKCPDCGNTDQIDIEARVNVRLIQHADTDDFETDSDEAEDRSHEWDDSCYATCFACGTGQILSKYNTDNDKNEVAHA